MTLSGANLLSPSTFAGSTVTNAVTANIPVGLYLLVLKRAASDNPSGAKYTLKVFTESTPTAVCPFSAGVLGPNIFSCTTTGSTTPTPDTSSFAAIT